jgi:serine/threonine-protein kinase
MNSTDRGRDADGRREDVAASASCREEEAHAVGGEATVESPVGDTAAVAAPPGVPDQAQVLHREAPAAAPPATVAYTAAELARKYNRHTALADTGEAVDAVAGTLIAGYQILETLGRGAMGVVYKARQPRLQRLVALKMILSGSHAGNEDLARFHSEAAAVAQLQHPNIVQIYEVGDDGGRPFFSLEYVDGTSLDKVAQQETLPLRAAASLIQKLALAMDYAHQRGIVHRDLKPANVLLAADGTPKITDFGLAKRFTDDSGQTRTGTVLGTPSYMSPEQAEGKPACVGPPCDVYALGAILYDLLTGRPPFRGTTPLETLDQVRTREPVPPLQLQPGLPRDLETICLKCLQKDVSQRYHSAAALAEDLGRFLDGTPIRARPVSRLEHLWHWSKRNPGTAGLSAAVILVVLIWAITSSVLAWQIKLQMDETDEQRQLAVMHEREAQQQAVLAKQNEEQARRQRLIAEKNEKRARDTAQASVQQMVQLGELLHKRLQARSLSVDAGPEVRRLREDVLGTLRKALGNLGQDLERVGTSPFARLATCQAMGDLLARLGQSEEALHVYKQGHELAKRLAEAATNNKMNDVARANLGIMLLRLGNVALDPGGDARRAQSYYRQARDLHLDVFNHPRSDFYSPIDAKRILSHDDVHLGRALLALGRADEARTYFQEALTYREAWATAEPKSVEPHGYVREAETWLGVAAGQRADAKNVEEHFARALLIGEELVRRFPKSANFQQDVAEMLGEQGDALFRLDKVPEAGKAYQNSLRSLELVLPLKRDDLSPQRLLARTHERLAAVAIHQGMRAEADKHYQTALGLRAELLQVETNSPARQANYLLALARAGKHADAAAGASKLRPRLTQSTQLLLQLARCWAHCATASQKDHCAAQALEALRTATNDDYKDAVVLETDVDLQALRDVPDLQALIARIKSRQ